MKAGDDLRPLLATIAALILAGPVAADKPVPGCHSKRCERRQRALWAAHHLGPHFSVSSTCYAQGGTTASGLQARFGIVAVLPGFLRLGTRIRLDRPAFGRRDFLVEDHIGSGSQLDIFWPSESGCNAYGRQQRGFRVSVAENRNRPR